MAAVDFWWVGWWGAGAGVVAVVRVAGVCVGGGRWGYDDSHGGHDDGVGWTHGHHLGHHLGHNLGTMWTSLGILRPVAMPNYSNCDPAVAKNQRVSILLAAICRPFVAICRKSAHHRVKPNGRQMVYLPVLGFLLVFSFATAASTVPARRPLPERRTHQAS